MREHVSTIPRSLEEDTLITVRARDGLSIVSLIVMYGMVLLMGELSSAVIATPLLLAALFVPSVLAFGAGQLALLPTVTVEDTLAVGITQFALLLVLVEPARNEVSWPVIIGTVLTCSVLSIGVAVGLRWGIVATGALLVGTIAIVIYLLHRLALVRLGLVTSTDGSSRPTQGGSDGGPPTSTPAIGSTNRHTIPPDESAADQSLSKGSNERNESAGSDVDSKD